ncbi:MAG: 2OG-Fe(II) oxygenase [Vibrio sp.]|uniref:2OG-Fe(II) oxygenase n=1 Tax=Vibrio sp. TaxID=678 RepID=UPI001ED15D48|nr:2OG-Fe(II) oxygenase [Vibrio sp.]NRB67650.1 2OG-Fe(II) oxygenase [Vibrio sp.]
MIDLISNRKMREKITQNGYLCIDDFFDKASFANFNKAVIDSWQQQQGWRTRVGHNGKKFNTELLTLEKREKVFQKMNLPPVPADRFSFIYHFVDQGSDVLVRKIAKQAMAHWLPILGLNATEFEQSFSLTSFNRYCFIDNHNDHTSSAQVSPYKVTIIVYFGDPEFPPSQSKLVFDYQGTVHEITPMPNRSVMFFPSPHTTHRVEHNQSQDDEPRLALSGWLM